jgi:hypothetical protein
VDENETERLLKPKFVSEKAKRIADRVVSILSDANYLASMPHRLAEIIQEELDR